MKNKVKKKIYNSIPLLFSVIAIIISIRSCQIADNTFNLDKNQYHDSLMSIWLFEYFEKGKYFKAKPSNEKVTLQGARLIYPDSISKRKWKIRLPENKLHIMSPISKLQKEINKIITKTDSVVKVLDNSFLPVVLESYYSINGKNLSNLSFYALRYKSIIHFEKYKDAEIKITGLTFVQNLEENTNVKVFLNQAWETKRKELDSINKKNNIYNTVYN